jgi:hypothetical protein
MRTLLKVIPIVAAVFRGPIAVRGPV